MESFAFIEFGFIIIGVALSWLQVRWLRNRKQKKNDIDVINERFNSVWDGLDENELFAWQIVKYELLKTNKSPTELQIEYIDNRIRKLNTYPIKSRTFVNEYGVLSGAIQEQGNY